MNIFPNKNTKKCSHTSGFTLVEVVIVLSILAVLTTTSVLGYTHFLKNARDSRRQVDLNTISTVLQEYRKNTGTYPDDLDELTTSTPPYIEELPVDPKEADPEYGYEYTKGGNSYSLSALLENGEYYFINPYGSNLMASNPQNIIPTPSVAFPTRTPTPTPPEVEFTQSYKYYANMYAKAHPWGDVVHYQYSTIVVNNVTNSPATIKIYIKNNDDGTNLLTTGDYLERVIPPKGQYNSFSEHAEFYGLDNGITENGNIRTTTGNDVDKDGVNDHDSAIGWVEIVSNKPLAGYSRVMLYDGPGLDDVIVDFDDEALEKAGNNQFYFPVFFHDTDTGDGVYRQSTDINILNPSSQPTNVTIYVRDRGEVAGTMTRFLPPKSRWSSWGNPAWTKIAGSDAETDGIIGSLEIISDTTEIFPMVRQRVTDPSVNSYTTPSESTDSYYANHKAFDDEKPLTQEDASLSLFAPSYLKKHDLDELLRWQWNDIQVMNIENGPANITIDIYKPGLSTPYHTITKTIGSKEVWASYSDPKWQPDDSTLPTPTDSPSLNPGGIPAMTDIANSWGAGWISITSDKKIIANNRTTIRDPGVNHPSNRNVLIYMDDEPMVNEEQASRKIYEAQMLRNWPENVNSGGNFRQFTNPILINPTNNTADVNIKVLRTDNGDIIHELNLTIDPRGYWNSYGDDRWYEADPTVYNGSDYGDATNGWTEITSTQPLFGLHRTVFTTGNTNIDASKRKPIVMMDDDSDALFYAEDIFACVDDSDCDGSLVCTDNECVLP